jgi:Fe-Mn family superoxide dismutase
MAHQIPELGYSYDALEPHIDAKTMEIHHTKHHQAYCNKLNAALEKHPDLAKKDPNELIANLNDVPEDIRSAVRNHGGGFVNHSFFWPILKKDQKFGGDIADAIKQEFGGFDQFREKFSTTDAGVFGSGWGWLVLSNGKLEILGTPNQDSPLTQGKTPLVGIDVWEHAYYLRYQNRRPDYIEAFFNVINWEKVNELYQAAK